MSRVTNQPLRFLSCDWGTSSFRLRLIDAVTFSVLGESRSEEGIGATHSAWKQAGGKTELRWDYYQEVIRRHLVILKERGGVPLEGVPLIVSGMASSSIGWVELPYKELPFATDGSDLRAEVVAATVALPHAVAIISGACTTEDVMRGEETQLIGALTGEEQAEGTRRLFILPGTHSKHLVVERSKVIELMTYMTGEFFNLLSRQSILSASVETGSNFDSTENREAFALGVQRGSAQNILHSGFGVRVRTLLGTTSKTSNYHYLSGLLIGSELGEHRPTSIPVTIVGSGPLATCYRDAIQVLGGTVTTKSIDADEATIKGQWKIALKLGLRLGLGQSD